MELYFENHRLLGGNDIDIKITQELLEKYLSKVVCMDDIEDDVDDYIKQLVRELHLNHRYGTDDVLSTLAVILECLNVRSSYTEIETNLAENTPFNSILNGFVMFILCQLEDKKYIHDTKYCTLTEKGKVMLWLFRQFEFVE